MMLPREALRLDAPAIEGKERDGFRPQLQPSAARSHPGGALQVEADLDAGRVEAVRPVQRSGGLQFLPLEAEALLAQAARQLPPGGVGTGPEQQLAARRRNRAGSLQRWLCAGT